MRRLALLLTVLALAPPAGAVGTPLLQATAMQPFAVHGVRFRPAERVTVALVAAGSTRVHVVRATRSGTFTTRFTAVWLDRCARWTVSARGAAGSTAILRARQFVDCSPQ